jgi:hypothetical protein
MESRALRLLGKHSTTEPPPSPISVLKAGMAPQTPPAWLCDLGQGSCPCQAMSSSSQVEAVGAQSRRQPGTWNVSHVSKSPGHTGLSPSEKTAVGHSEFSELFPSPSGFSWLLLLWGLLSDKIQIKDQGLSRARPSGSWAAEGSPHSKGPVMFRLPLERGQRSSAAVSAYRACGGHARL